MLLMGVLYIVVGLLFLNRPVSALEALTLLLACSLMVSGVFRIVGSLLDRFPHWGWIFFGGVLNLVLGLMIWQQWPVSGFWVIGLFVGIDMIFNGWTWIMLALRLKQLPAGRQHHDRAGVNQSYLDRCRAARRPTAGTRPWKCTPTHARSHALRGNAVRDALRPRLRGPRRRRGASKTAFPRRTVGTSSRDRVRHQCSRRRGRVKKS